MYKITDEPNIVQNLQEELNTLLDLYQAHDSVHPDKDECGGVGRCLMMRTEVDQEREITETYLRQIAQKYRLRIGVLDVQDHR